MSRTGGDATSSGALTLSGIHVALAGAPIVAGIDLEVRAGERVGLVGPNGSGKSTLLRTVYRHLPADKGTAWIDGNDLWAMKPRHAARRIATVPQETHPEFDITARDMVAMGRTPHKSAFAADDPADREIIAEALRQVDMLALAARRFAALSGGEKQRILIARALAQRTHLLLLDEPTNHLDLHHQFALLELVTRTGLTTLTALHDLNLAAAYCDRLYVLAAGAVVASGTPESVLTPTLLRDVFRVQATITAHPSTGRPHLTLHPLT
ncbi:ABC transporter ATP-binding protein [Nocardia panacis]|uniref:ABC transporter ATP-binding protein n=1 Tax=Nocardia panacis TaxID=2340916 RepID=A0A3A4K371_9NOCA|nr:ABC transporter ATP-binding protein [Nocardia panacis]RJO70944.1 ABC transporter ATP-binding protein [Nocardia panacis]